MLKSSYETAHVPVVLFSAVPSHELETLARECEADGFLSKANGLERLPQELELLIETRCCSRSLRQPGGSTSRGTGTRSPRASHAS